MTSIYQDIVRLSEQNEKLLAVLIDPDKIEIESISSLSKQIQNTHVNYIFVGGSEVEESNTEEVVMELKRQTKRKLKIPLIVGGGIRSKVQLDDAYNAGADLVVIGTAFENDENFFNSIK